MRIYPLLVLTMRKSTAAAALTLAVFLQGCGPSESPPPPPPEERSPGFDYAEQTGPENLQELIQNRPGAEAFDFTAYAYDCNGISVIARPQDGELTLMLPERELTLPQVEATSGVKYSDDETVFWGKSINTATLAVDGEERQCTLNRSETTWVDARIRGVLFRAANTEPRWHIEVRPEQIVMVHQYGEARVEVPNPGVQDEDGLRKRWRVETEAHQLEIVAEQRACTDVMAGEVNPWTVTVTLDGRSYTGCGRDLN